VTVIYSSGNLSAALDIPFEYEDVCIHPVGKVVFTRRG
jgi:hypothetical protein